MSTSLVHSAKNFVTLGILFGEERRGEERRGRERRGEHEKDLLAQLFNTQPKTDIFNNPQPLTHPEN